MWPQQYLGCNRIIPYRKTVTHQKKVILTLIVMNNFVVFMVNDKKYLQVSLCVRNIIFRILGSINWEHLIHRKIQYLPSCLANNYKKFILFAKLSFALLFRKVNPLANLVLLFIESLFLSTVSPH